MQGVRIHVHVHVYAQVGVYTYAYLHMRIGMYTNAEMQLFLTLIVRTGEKNVG